MDRRSDRLDRLAALVLSLINLVWGQVLPWWRERAALGRCHMEVRHVAGGYVAIKNHGPAVARDVAIAHAESRNGDELPENVKDELLTRQIPALAPQQQYFLRYIFVPYAPHPDVIELAWRDHVDRQRFTFHVSIEPAP